jgi:hypothetical protein
LFFGIAPVKKAKDTTLVDFENAKLDIWGYKDDYLQPMQLKNAERDSKKSYLTAIEIFNSDPKIIPLTDLKLPDASVINEGNSPLHWLQLILGTGFSNNGLRTPSEIIIS